MYNEDTFKPADPSSAADAEQEDAAMEESEEEPAQESNPLVTSLAARPEDSDSDTCSDHPSQFEEANSGIDEDIALEDQAMEESKDEPAQATGKRVEPASELKKVFDISKEARPEDTKTKREFDRENAVVKDGYYICNKCGEPVCLATVDPHRNMSQFFSKGAHKGCNDWPYLKQK